MSMLHKQTPTPLFKLIPRMLAVVLVAFIVALPAGLGTAIARADEGNTSAVAVNTRDGSLVFRLTFAIRRVTGNVVNNLNAAIAYSSCTDCQTVAISIQVLLISGTVTTFTPTNEAIAINQNCDLCDTLAAAYQFAVGVGNKVKFTADGRREIADIRHQLELLRNAGLTGPQIDAQVTALTSRLANVLQTQLVLIRKPAAAPAEVSPPVRSTTTPTLGPGTPTDATPAPSSAPTNTTPTTTTSPEAPSSTTTAPSSAASPTTATTPSNTADPGTTTTPTNSTPPTTTTTTTTPTTTTTTTTTPASTP